MPVPWVFVAGDGDVQGERDGSVLYNGWMPGGGRMSRECHVQCREVLKDVLSVDGC